MTIHSDRGTLPINSGIHERMALSLIQDTAPKKGLAAIARLAHRGMKETQADQEITNNNNNNNDNNNRSLGGFHPGVLTPGQLFPAALMSPLALHAGSLFHHSLNWVQSAGMQTLNSTSTGNRSTSKHKRNVVDVDMESSNAPLSPPTSGSSPQSTASSGHDVGTKDNREKVFTCTICNRSFGYKHVLQNHERTHTGEKPFECTQCYKRFTRDHHLKTHMRLHTGEKPYHCTHCDRHFVQVANLRRHLRVHTGERPYACELCSSRFSDSNQLKAHMLIHKGEKPFECDKCSSRFRRRHHLMHHKCQHKDIDIEPSSTPTSNPPYKSDEDLDDEDMMDHRNIHQDEDNDVDLELDSRDDICGKTQQTIERKQRKSRDIRRVVRLLHHHHHLQHPELPQIVPGILPEQTEPEDLSIPSKRHDRDALLWQQRHPKFRRHISTPLS